MQVRLKLEYDGTNYAGWQIQTGRNSIQAELEGALERTFATCSPAGRSFSCF